MKENESQSLFNEYFDVPRNLFHFLPTIFKILLSFLSLWLFNRQYYGFPFEKATLFKISVAWF